MQRLVALKFSTATLDDICDEDRQKAEGMVQGTQIRQYDVVLMKIPLMLLMSYLKNNIMTSAYKLDSAVDGRLGQAAANQSFSDLLGSDPDALNTNAKGQLNKYRQATGKEPVTFTRT